MAKSIAEKVQDFITKNPECSNQDLYAKFPKVRPNTLRHYKSKFAGATTAAQEDSKSQAKGTLSQRMSQLEDRVLELEGKRGLKSKSESKNPLKGRLGLNAETLDKTLKDLEDNLISFIKDAKSKVKAKAKEKGDFNVEELQAVITGKVTQLFNSIKNRDGDKS